MDIRTITVEGFEPAFHAMRNPMDSWAKSDSWYALTTDYDERPDFKVGPKDQELSLKLQAAGPEHCKHLRMINVWADITGPRYWWTEFDTYRAGVEKISCSTMHKLMARPLTPNDFEHDSINPVLLSQIIFSINEDMARWQKCEDPEEKKKIWRGIIQILPQSYKQNRTVMMSYAALRNIVQQREGHKLVEWRQFIKWASDLPESWMIL